MYQVLYRKWRPMAFSDVVGQQHITSTLQNQLKNNRVSHAYLFTGSRGTGKTTCAKILAKAVNCLNLKDGNPCNECEMCRAANDGSLMDVVEIDAASNNKVEDVRSLIEEVIFNPNVAKYRVYIIDEVHMLSKSAFNALLKTLEEPPTHVVFILATTEVHDLPGTILSRCQRFDFNRISPKDIADRLLYVANEENINLDYDAAMLIAGASDGALRDALSLLDSAMSISSDVTADVVRQATGMANKDYLFAISENVFSRNVDEIMKIVNELYKKSVDASRLCKELTDHYRSLMLIKTMKDPFDLVVMTKEEAQRAKNLTDKTSLEFMTYAIKTLQNAFSRMKLSVNIRTELELALIKLSSEQLDDSAEAVLCRIAKLEADVKNILLNRSQYIVQNTEEIQNKVDTELKNIQKNNAVTEEFKSESIKSENTRTLPDNTDSSSENKPVEAKSIPSEAPKTNATAKQTVNMNELKQNAVVFEGWGEVIEIISMYSKAISLAFEDTTAYISGDYLLIDSDADIPFKLLRQSAQRDKVREAIKKVTGRVYKLGPYNVKEESKEDPLKDLIQKAQSFGVDVENIDNK